MSIKCKTVYLFSILVLLLIVACSNNPAPTDILVSVPEEPQNIQVSETGKNYITISWDESKDITVVRYEYSVDDGLTWNSTNRLENFIKIAKSGSYIFRVRAVDSVGVGDTASLFIYELKPTPIPTVYPTPEVKQPSSVDNDSEKVMTVKEQLDKIREVTELSETELTCVENQFGENYESEAQTSDPFKILDCLYEESALDYYLSIFTANVDSLSQATYSCLRENYSILGAKDIVRNLMKTPMSQDELDIIQGSRLSQYIVLMHCVDDTEWDMIVTNYPETMFEETDILVNKCVVDRVEGINNLKNIKGSVLKGVIAECNEEYYPQKEKQKES